MTILVDSSFNPAPLPSVCKDHSEEIKAGTNVILRCEDLGPRNNAQVTIIRSLLPARAAYTVLELTRYGARLPTEPCPADPKIPRNLYVPLAFLVPVQESPVAASG